MSEHQAFEVTFCHSAGSIGWLAVARVNAMVRQLLRNGWSEVCPSTETDDVTVDGVSTGVFPHAARALRETGFGQQRVSAVGIVVERGAPDFFHDLGCDVEVRLQRRILRHCQRVECCGSVVRKVSKLLAVKVERDRPTNVRVVVRTELTARVESDRHGPPVDVTVRLATA